MSHVQKVPLNVSVTNRTLIRVILLVGATFIGLMLVSSIAHVLGLIAIAFFLALALNPAISWIIKRLHIKSRGLATALAYVALLAVLATLGYITLRPLARQTTDFINQLPSTVHNLATQDSGIGRFARQHNLNGQLDTIAGDFRNRLFALRWKALTTAANIGTTLIAATTVFVMTFMMLVEGPYWRKRFWEFYPPRYRAAHQKLGDRMYRIVTGYVNGQLLIAAIAAGAALVALLTASSLLGVTINAVGLAGVVGLIGLIPMIGNTIAAIIVVLICLFESLPLAIIMAVFFLIYQQIENVTLQPMVQSRFNELTPLLVFIAALLGVGFGGLLGAFIGIPLAGCLKLIFNEYMRTREQVASHD